MSETAGQYLDRLEDDHDLLHLANKKIAELEDCCDVLVFLVRRMARRFDIVGEMMEYLPEEWQGLSQDLKDEIEREVADD